MSRLRCILLGLASLHFGNLTARADFINGGFESGTMAGWAAAGNGGAAVGVDSFRTLTTSPLDGAYQAMLNNVGSSADAGALEAFLGMSAGTLNSLAAGNGEGAVINGSAIAQTVSVKAGDVLNIHWNFATNDVAPFDFGFVSIGGKAFSLATAATTGNAKGNFSSTGYQTFSYTFASDGTFSVGVGVVNTGDNVVESRIYVDSVSAGPVASVPEPSSLALLALAVSGGVVQRVRSRRS